MRMPMDGVSPGFRLHSDATWTCGSNEGPSLHRLPAQLAVMAMGVSADDVAIDCLSIIRQGDDDGMWQGELVDQIDEGIARVGDPPVL